MEKRFFLNVIHEEPLSNVTLEELKGGASCTCNSDSKFSCNCVGANNFCACNSSANFSL